MILNNLKAIREYRELPQREVARALQISLGTYAMNETGHDTITLNNLVKFCDYFDVSVDYVLGFTNKEKYLNSVKGFDRDVLKDRLKTVRKDNKYTQEMIGNLLNIDHSVWCR